jgi:glycosyltransferase involved in cell wall biosynthesis
VTVVDDGANRGISYRRNQIAQLATAAHVAYLDADDLMHPSRLERQINYFSNNPAVDVVGTATYIIDGNNALTGIRLRNPIDLRPISILKHGLMLQGTLMGRREWFVANPQDPTFLRAQDHEMWCRTYHRSTFGKIPEPLYFYRVSYRAPRDYLKLYLLNGVNNRRLFRMYGPQMVGWRQTQQLILRSYLKDWVYRIGTLAGRQSSVIGKRNQPLTPEEYADGMKALNTVLTTPVPGLPARAHTHSPEFEGTHEKTTADFRLRPGDCSAYHNN